MYLEEGLYDFVPPGQYNPWMAPEQFSTYMSWPRNRPNFYGGGEAGSSNATGADEEADQQKADFDTDLDRIMRGG